MRPPWILVSIPHQLEDFSGCCLTRFPFLIFLILPFLFLMNFQCWGQNYWGHPAKWLLIGFFWEGSPKVEKRLLFLPLYLRCWSFLNSCSSRSVFALTAVSLSHSLSALYFMLQNQNLPGRFFSIFCMCACLIAFCLVLTSVWTQDFVNARPAFYYWAVPPSPTLGFSFFTFSTYYIGTSCVNLSSIISH